MDVVTDQGQVWVGLADTVNSDGVDRMVSIRVEPNCGEYALMTPEKALEVASRLMLRVSELGEL